MLCLCFSPDVALQLELTTETHFTAESLGQKEVAGGGGGRDGGKFDLP